MNRLSKEKRQHIIHCLVEGCSIRATARLTSTRVETVLDVLVHAGRRAEAILGEVFREFESDHLQFDEVWTFVAPKRMTLKRRGIPEKSTTFGDWYIYSAIDTESRAVPVYLVGRRDGQTTRKFVHMVRKRVKINGSVDLEISTDQYDPYEKAIIGEFGLDVDYGHVVKVHKHEHSGRGRYAPPRFAGVRRCPIVGYPQRMSTSYVERHNWTLRGINRRMTRLSNGFSRKLENLKAQVALGYYFYNLVKPHKSLGGQTPAMALGVWPEPWALRALVAA